MPTSSKPAVPKLRVGLLLDSTDVPAWSLRLFQNIVESNYAELVLVVLNTAPVTETNTTVFQKIKNNRGRLGYLAVRRVLELAYEKLIERNTYLLPAERIEDSQPLLRALPVVEVEPASKGPMDYFSDTDINRIKSHSVDILLRCGFGILRGAILSAARFGIWSYHHGDNRVNRGGPAGFWESMENRAETGSILQILSEDLDNGQVLYRSWSCTDAMSVQDNKNNYYWKSIEFTTRKMRELHRDGEAVFFARVHTDNRHPEFYSQRLYKSPTNTELARLTLKKIVQKAALLIENQFYLHQWILLFHLREDFSSSLWRYRKIVPPPDRFWADPHVLHRNDRYYLFIEEYLYETGKGHIALIEMDSRGNYSEPVTVLDKPYHLSYPFVFEHADKTYMVPESMDNRTVSLYECSRFPDQWTLRKHLLEDIAAVDATLLHKDGKWWLFANVVETDGASSWDELSIFFANDLLDDHWTAHPQNPVVSDCRSARPAGKIFSHKGQWYRPSQNCSHHYGYGFNLAQIITLSETQYEEAVVTRVEPDWDKNLLGTHTFNRVNDLHVADAILRRRKNRSYKR